MIGISFANQWQETAKSIHFHRLINNFLPTRRRRRKPWINRGFRENRVREIECTKRWSKTGKEKEKGKRLWDSFCIKERGRERERNRQPKWNWDTETNRLNSIYVCECVRDFFSLHSFVDVANLIAFSFYYLFIYLDPAYAKIGG